MRMIYIWMTSVNLDEEILQVSFNGNAERYRLGLLMNGDKDVVECLCQSISKSNAKSCNAF